MMTADWQESVRAPCLLCRHPGQPFLAAQEEVGIYHCREPLGRGECRRIKELKSRGTDPFPQCPPHFDWVNFALSVSLVYTY